MRSNSGLISTTQRASRLRLSLSLSSAMSSRSLQSLATSTRFRRAWLPAWSGCDAVVQPWTERSVAPWQRTDVASVNWRSCDDEWSKRNVTCCLVLWRTYAVSWTANAADCRPPMTSCWAVAGRVFMPIPPTPAIDVTNDFVFKDKATALCRWGQGQVLEDASLTPALRRRQRTRWPSSVSPPRSERVFKATEVQWTELNCTEVK